MKPSLSEMADLAIVMKLTNVQAVALPTVLTVAADKTGCTERVMFDACMRKPLLRDYLADACRAATDE